MLVHKILIAHLLFFLLAYNVNALSFGGRLIAEGTFATKALEGSECVSLLKGFSPYTVIATGAAAVASPLLITYFLPDKFPKKYEKPRIPAQFLGPGIIGVVLYECPWSAGVPVPLPAIIVSPYNLGTSLF